MDREEFLNTYWRYYELLETDFKNSIRYVSLDEKNYNTFSVEYARLLQAICSEIDVLFKELCSCLNKKGNNISDYADILLKNDSTIPDRIIYLKMYHRGFEICPFKNWKKGNAPTWWGSYNEIKHHRKENMQKANQKNVLYALAGLFLLENILLKNIILENKETYPCVDYPSVLFYMR